MKGSILDFDIQTSEGIISSNDENRYKFTASDIKSENKEPITGAEVDFEVNENEAKDIYIIKNEQSSDALAQEASGILNHYINAFKNYATFQGRSTRSAFWYYQLVNFIIGIVLTAISAGILGLIYYLAVFIPGLAIGARRLHDTNRSGWWQLIAIIPLLGIIVLIIFWAQNTKSEKNKFDID